MENFTCDPASGMLGPNAFQNFPADVQSVFVKNLVWDMCMIEKFAWDYTDSLKINNN